MNDVLHQFLAQAKSITLSQREKTEVRATLITHLSLRTERLTLTAEEKDRGRNVLRSFIHDHPIGPSSFSFFDFLRTLLTLHLPATAVATFILIVTISGTVAYAAESSLPGDLFYPIKVRVTEPLREQFHRTPEGRTRWTIRRIERRLAEAKTLKQQNRLDQKHLDMVHAALQEHASTLEHNLSPLPPNEQEQFHISLQVTLEKYRSTFDEESPPERGEPTPEKHQQPNDSLPHRIIQKELHEVPILLEKIQEKEQVEERSEHIKEKIREKTLEEISPELEIIEPPAPPEEGKTEPPRKLPKTKDILPQQRPLRDITNVLEKLRRSNHKEEKEDTPPEKEKYGTELLDLYPQPWDLRQVPPPTEPLPPQESTPPPLKVPLPLLPEEIPVRKSPLKRLP